jgi:hypothetical protein
VGKGATPQSGWKLPLASVGLGAAAATFGSATISQPQHYIGPENMAPPATSTSGVQYVEERLLTARLEAVEARTDVKFAQLIGKLDAFGTKLDSLSTVVGEAKAAASSVKPYVIGTGLAIAGVIVAIAAFGAQILQTAFALAEM